MMHLQFLIVTKLIFNEYFMSRLNSYSLALSANCWLAENWAEPNIVFANIFWCNWRVLSSCSLLGPLAHPGPGIWPVPSPQQILSPRDGLLQVQIRPSLKSLENCPWVPWHKESHSVKRISATLIDWKLIQGQGIWMSSGRNILNVILKKYVHSDRVREMPGDIDTSFMSFLALRGQTLPAAKCFNP